MRAIICGCGERLEAADDERLVEEVATHMKQVHSDHVAASLTREQVRRVVANRAYKLEYALVYEVDEPNEEFGPDPYKEGPRAPEPQQRRRSKNRSGPRSQNLLASHRDFWRR